MTARILVVDDELDLELLILQRFRRQISDGEFSFVFADDGVDALAKLDANPDIEMLLCDTNMPRMDGLTLLGRLQERGAPPATVIVSAYGDMANIRTAMNRGAFDFLMKPIDFIDLEATLDKTIRHVEVLREAKRQELRVKPAGRAACRKPQLHKLQSRALAIAQPGRPAGEYRNDGEQNKEPAQQNARDGTIVAVRQPHERGDAKKHQRHHEKYRRNHEPGNERGTKTSPCLGAQNKVMEPVAHCRSNFLSTSITRFVSIRSKGR